MDTLELESHESPRSTSLANKQRNQPLGEPRQIVAVFCRDKSFFVKVNMARDYERANDWRVHEYLPQTFDVGEFRQRFPRSKHADVIQELDEKVAELDRNRHEGKATVHAWIGQLLGWLQPILACLSFRSENHPSHGCREDQIRGVNSTGDDLNDGKVYSRMSQQPMILQPTSTGQSSPQVIPVERANICVPPAAASNASISSDSTNLPPVGDHIAHPNSYVPRSLLQLTLSEYAPAYVLPFKHRAHTSILAGDTVLWIESLEVCPGIGVRAQKMLVRRDQKCRFILGDISLEKLCFGRESNIRAVVGDLDFFVAWRLHRGEPGCQYLTYTGPPIEQVIAAALHRQILPRKGGNS